ncbi:hypothetical protein FDECE_17942 [Fusarium decemcellulare]|nr:hypothetical protein FDECE_17942 [Fusarium decemcellulare]
MVPKPKALSWTDAAATPVSALTAWQGLFEHGTLGKAAIDGDENARAHNSKIRVLVAGSGGGVGSWAVQLASAAGAGSIVAVCRPSRAEEARKLGAAEAVDYTSQPIGTWVAKDTASREAIKNWGKFLSVAGQPNAVEPKDEVKTIAKGEWFLVQPPRSDLVEISTLVEADKVMPLVGSVYRFDQFQEAFDKVQGGRTKGKVTPGLVAERAWAVHIPTRILEAQTATTKVKY